MTKLSHCDKGPNGEPCGNARKGQLKTIDQCPRCWIFINKGLSIKPVITTGIPIPTPNWSFSRDWSGRKDRCVFLRDKTQVDSKCRSGLSCRHDCLKGLPAVPNRYCQGCTSYVAHNRVNPVNPVPWVGDWEDFAEPGETLQEPIKLFVPQFDVSELQQLQVQKTPRATVETKSDRSKEMRWMYGITTVPSRRHNLFPRTLASLRAGGFDKPHLFIDGEPDGSSWGREFGLEVTARGTNVRTAGHWYLSMIELYVRNPHADRFAIFQDDFVTVKNLRQYLEQAPYPEKSYLNLYTFPRNEHYGRNRPQPESQPWFRTRQTGLGAVALVFSRLALQTLLSSPRVIERPMHPTKGHRSVDGGIVWAMKERGWSEFCHLPSLVQHTGDESSMGNRKHPHAATFPGEEFNALTFLDSQFDWSRFRKKNRV